MNHKTILINKIKNSIYYELQPNGFRYDKKAIRNSGKIYESWNNDKDWKVETVRIIYAIHKPYSINLDLNLFLKISENDIVYYAGTSVNYLVGKENETYKFPLIFLNLRANNFLRSIINDLDTAISWFNIFHSPKKCLQEIKENRIGLPFKGEKYEKVFAFLEQNSYLNPEVEEEVVINPFILKRWNERERTAVTVAV